MPVEEQLQRILGEYDRNLAGLEDQVTARVNTALEASYKQLEKKLIETYPRLQANGSLTAIQQKTLLTSEVTDLLALLNTRNSERIYQDFEYLLQTSNGMGGTLASELHQAIANQPLKATTGVPVDALRFAAENAVKRLSKHDQEFQEKATAIVGQGLIQNWGVQRSTRLLRQELGITKGKAERIIRTETLAATNEAAQASFKEAGIKHFQFIATQDDRLCPFCAARNLKVFKLGQSVPPIHPYCRCFSMPWMESWVDEGLLDVEWQKQYREDSLRELESTGKQLNNGLSPFEKAAGLTKPPKPVWEPGRNRMAVPLAETAVAVTAVGLRYLLENPKSARFALQMLQKAAEMASPVQTPSITHEQLIERGKLLAASLGEKPTLEQVRGFRRNLIKSGLSRELAEKLTNLLEITPEADGIWQSVNPGVAVDDVVTEFHRLTGGALRLGNRPGDFQGFIYASPRPHADLRDRSINVGQDPYEEALFHELGHFLEAQNPELAKAARAWRDARATGSKQSLRQLTGLDYQTSEQAVPDGFVNPYVGKVYRDGLTEVVSTGLEHFGSAETMKHLLKEDPEHFYLTLGILDEAQRSRRTGKSSRALTAKSPLFSGLQDTFSGGYRPLTPVEEEMQRSQQKNAAAFKDYLKREEESIRRRTSGEIDRQLKEYYDAEAAALRRRLGIPTPVQSQAADGKGGLQIVPQTRTLKPLPVRNDLDGLEVDRLNETQRKALGVAREYQQLLQEVNEVMGKIPGDGRTLPPDAYGRIYSKINQLMDRLKGTVNEAKQLSGKTGNETLESYMSQISTTSKEGLPGYQIRSASDAIAKKAEVRPC